MTRDSDVTYGGISTRTRCISERLQREFSADGMLIVSAANIRYLTGFVGEASGLLVFPERVVLMTDARYKSRAVRAMAEPHLERNQVEVVGQAKMADFVGRSLPGPARLVIEGKAMSMALHTQLKAELPRVDLIPADDIILEQRLIKDAGEIARIRAAAAITDGAVEDLLTAEPIGWSESEIASYLIERLIALGAERAAFEPLVATGERSAFAHSRPSHKRLRENEILLIDVGAEVDGYKADLTRTVWWGELSDELKRVASAVDEAYSAAVEVAGPGVRYAEVDDAARAVLRGFGLESFLVHPVGHNVGLEIHERPFLGQHFEGSLDPGNVVTIEPGVYLPELGGVRMENTFVISDKGPVPLTMATASGQMHRWTEEGNVSVSHPDPAANGKPSVHRDSRIQTSRRFHEFNDR